MKLRKIAGERYENDEMFAKIQAQFSAKTCKSQLFLKVYNNKGKNCQKHVKQRDSFCENMSMTENLTD